jgi:hypothetical protein
MRQYIIRKNKTCGHWVIFLTTFHPYAIVTFREVAHLETFGDVLVLCNLKERVS